MHNNGWEFNKFITFKTLQKPWYCNKYITTNLRYNTFNKIKCYAQEIYYFM